MFIQHHLRIHTLLHLLLLHHFRLSTLNRRSNLFILNPRSNLFTLNRRSNQFILNPHSNLFTLSHRNNLLTLSHRNNLLTLHPRNNLSTLSRQPALTKHPVLSIHQLKITSTLHRLHFLNTLSEAIAVPSLTLVRSTVLVINNQQAIHLTLGFHQANRSSPSHHQRLNQNHNHPVVNFH
jgi:hypothetical protein